MKTDTPRTIRLKDYRPPAYLIDSVDLDIALDPARTRVIAKLKIRPNPALETPGGPLQLDGEHLELIDLRLGGTKLTPKDYKLTPTGLTIHKVPERPFTLETTTFVNPEANKALQGIYRSRGVYCSQCEAQGFRRITYFLDRPDVLSVYTCRIEASAAGCPILLSNGNLKETGKLEKSKRHFAIWHDPHPKPCYLFAVVGGDLGVISSSFKTVSGREVALNIYVEHGKEARAEWAMDSLKRSMRWDEKRFGREYDLNVFNIVAVSDFNMGAMENKGLNIFNDRLILASAETATDTMYEAIEGVVAHEYFHNWTGNRITCRDWFQLCLKEGLTVYRDQEFSGDERSRTVQRITDVRQLKAHQFPEDAGPLAHPVRPESYIEINNFYTATVYEKGAELVRMISGIVGAKAFRAGMDLYFARHDGDAATIEDFLRCFEEAANTDLTQFKLWYRQAGTPEVVATLTYDRTAKSAELELSQMQRDTPGDAKKKPLHIPIKLALLGADGAELPLVLEDGSKLPDGVLHLTERCQSVRFTGLSQRPVPSLLREFSAPVNLTMDLSDRDLEFLMQHDSELFNRWQAATTYATRTLLHMVSALQVGKRSNRGASYAKALSVTLSDKSLEPAYRAELMRLPGQSDVAREMARNVDPGVIFKAVKQLSKLTATLLGDQLEEFYAASKPRGGYSPDSKSNGLRAQRNGALSLLCARASPQDTARLMQHFIKASNMTDEAHALVLLAASSSPQRDEALARFFERWQGDHLVIDTWFAAQAQSPLDTTLDTVKELTRHPLFSLTAPNKVRALIGAFAQQNPVQFNRPDGAGYAFLSEMVLEIGKFNPQIAARLLSILRSWRSLEPVRRGLARKTLRTIASAKDLPADVYEIVTKMLDD
mgnify:CR=1 FL=1